LEEARVSSQNVEQPTVTNATALECFFDCSSPWTYLAFESLQPLAAEFNLAIDWRPILVGGIFNTVNPTVYAMRSSDLPPAKARHQRKTMTDWARLVGITFKCPRGGDKWQPTVFPVNSVNAMRGCILLGPEGKLVPFARAVFQIYWSEDQDISQNSVLTEVCKRVGIDPEWFFAGIAEPAIKSNLRANTDEVIRRGGFGSPTIFVNRTDMYWGNDSLPLVRYALQHGQTA
jgi:2-hydroxychromene-2-carboxylate isomerase